MLLIKVLVARAQPCPGVPLASPSALGPDWEPRLEASAEQACQPSMSQPGLNTTQQLKKALLM